MIRDHMIGFQQPAEGSSIDPRNWWCADEFPQAIRDCDAADVARAFEHGDHTPEHMRPAKVEKAAVGICAKPGEFVTVSGLFALSNSTIGVTGQSQMATVDQVRDMIAEESRKLWAESRRERERVSFQQGYFAAQERRTR